MPAVAFGRDLVCLLVSQRVQEPWGWGAGGIGGRRSPDGAPQAFTLG